MPLPFLQIDAFTSEPFGGNPAAVVLLPAAAEADWMSSVAAEMNLAATAFLVARGGTEYDLRWFTPTVEINLCGHATLASAHALWQRGDVPAAEILKFHTRSGVLTAARRGDWVELDFPALSSEASDPPDGLVEALGAQPLSVMKTRFDYLVEVANQKIVAELKPDLGRLRTLPVRGVIVTSKATTEGWDFVSRFFAPGSGIAEDQVTGSAHCALTPYWAKTLGKTTFTARQMSPRGGTLQTELKDNRVLLRGQAVTVLRGELTT